MILKNFTFLFNAFFYKEVEEIIGKIIEEYNIAPLFNT